MAAVVPSNLLQKPASEQHHPRLSSPRLPTLAERLEVGTPYDSYVYAYPHKTAYGPLDPPRLLKDVWKSEDKSALFLYLHVPFCEMRCGFCNLFTTPKPQTEMVARYVTMLERQAVRVRDALGGGSDEAKYARFAIGGGTPTLLDPEALVRVLDLAENTMGADLRAIPGSVETSPETCSADRMRILRDRGIDRISIGIQSFIEKESASVNRPQKNSEVFAALANIREAGFPVLNLDLIYGLPDQTIETWEASLRTALEWKPEELYLYPLYVRPVTTLSRSLRNPRRVPEPSGRRDWDDERLGMYRHARDFLLAHGYEQVSMRMFRRVKSTGGSIEYCVQDDGMIGLGPGARSYTRALHYSTEWAVGAKGVKEILGAWLDSDDPGFDVARWGFALSPDEQRRRWVAYSLFVADGLPLATYRRRFGDDVLDVEQLPMLGELLDTGAAIIDDNETMKLTPLGIERSDTIGPWLYSADVRTRMAGFALR
jgi:oxygen-independent coproporphyrinogen III oxidase